MNHRSHLVFEPDVQNALSQYIVDLFVKELPVQTNITVSTENQGLPQIDLRAEEGWMLYLLTRMIGARRAVEFGTLAGYSATWILRGLGEDGKLITLEYDAKHAEVARGNIAQAGFGEQAEIVVGDAHRTMHTLEGPFDLVFIDADKPGYDDYLTWALDVVRPGGLIVAHNAFQHGKIVENGSQSPMQRFNARVAVEERLLSTIIPVGDGLLVALVL